MKLTTAEKFVIGANIFLSLLLLTLLLLQFVTDKADINVQQLLNPSPSSTFTPTNAPNIDIFSAVEVPEPTAEEEIGAKQPRRAWVGWTIIIISTLLALGGLITKFIRH